MSLDNLAHNLNRIESYLNKQEARLVLAATPEWFKKMTKEEQKQYLKEHPGSKMKVGQYRKEKQKITKLPSGRKIIKQRGYNLLNVDRQLAKWAYHGTYKKAADRILSKGVKTGISLTANPHNAIMYAFQRSEKYKDDGIVLKIRTSALNKKFIEENDVSSNTTEIFYRGKIAKDKFSIFKVIPYKEVFGKIRNQEKELTSYFEKVLRGTRLKTRKGSDDRMSWITSKPTLYVVRLLVKDGWKIVRKVKQNWYGIHTSYTLKKDSIKLDLGFTPVNNGTSIYVENKNQAY